MREIDPRKYTVNILIRGTPPKTRLYAELSEEELHHITNRRCDAAMRSVLEAAEAELKEVRRRTKGKK